MVPLPIARGTQVRSDLTDLDTKVGSADDCQKIGGPSEREQLERRQTLRVALAVFLIWIAVTSTSKAGQIGFAPPCTPSCTLSSIQFDGFTPLPIADKGSVDRGNQQAV